MSSMLQELKAKPELGLLHFENYTPTVFDILTGKPTLMVQYWRSSDDLMNFARDASNTHWGPWIRFQKDSRSSSASGPFGIWHETYLVDDGKFESVYNGISSGFGGMGAFPMHRIKPGAMATARKRLGQHDDAEALVAAMPDDVYASAGACPAQHKQD